MAIFDRAIIGQILWFATGVVAVFGLCVGSFLNVVVWRLPRGESLNHPGSHCPRCGHGIRAWENLPLLSWLLLRGRCSQCSQPISVRYPLVEGANGLLWLALWWRLWGSGLPLTHGPGWFLLASALLAASLIDLDHLLLPDAINRFGVLAALALALVFPESYALGAVGAHTLFSQLVAGALGPLSGQPHVLALARLAAGVGLGYGLLWLVRALGRRFWGRLVVRPDSPAVLRATADSVRMQGVPDAPLGEWLPHPDDFLVVDFSAGRLKRRQGKGENWPAGRVEIGAGGVRRDEVEIPWSEIAGLRLEATAWSRPREVLGRGDLKLLAMIGAFLGPDAALSTAALGALAGLVAGGVRAFSGRRGPLPFGPFLSLGALVWLVCGPELLGAYSSWLLSLFPPPL